MSSYVEDLGRPIAHLAVEEGAAVYDRSGNRVGVVDHVLTDSSGRIFEGLIVHTHPLPGRHVFASHDQIAELHERGVVLSAQRDELHEIRDPSTRRRGSGEPADGRIEAALRRAWDWISGIR
jgi:uncharacterized protein YrrD